MEVTVPGFPEMGVAQKPKTLAIYVQVCSKLHYCSKFDSVPSQSI